MQRIIYVDDDVRIGKLVKDYLEMDKFQVKAVQSFDELMKIDYFNYELMLLDIMLPNKNGIDICKTIRNKVSYPIIFLSALGMEINFVTALEAGGDDYITKPFTLKTLKAKIQSHLRREERRINSEKLLLSGNINLNIKNKTITINDEIISFPKKEYLVIEKLMNDPGQIFNKEQLFESIWGHDSNSDILTIAEHIKRIRNKISELDKEYSYIQTKYGLGYYWEPRYEK